MGEIKCQNCGADLAAENRPSSPNFSSLAIEKLPLSNRAYNGLKRNGVNTVAEMKAVYENGRLYQFRNVGANTIEEIGTLLNKLENNDVKIETEDDTSIEATFPERTFLMFRNYCAHNGIASFADLEGFDFNKLLSVYGFGPGKVEQIEHRYEVLCNAQPRNNNLRRIIAEDLPQQNKYPFENIHSSNRSLSIRILRFLDIPSALLRLLEAEGIVSLSNLAAAKEEDLRKILGANFRAVKEATKTFYKPVRPFAEEIMAECAGEKSYAVYIQRAEGRTLQEIADILGLTRERVRQICLKFERKIHPIMMAVAETVSAENGGGYCTEEQLLNVFAKDEYGKALILSLKTSDVYDYLDFAEVFVNKNVYPDAEGSLCRLADEIVGDGIDFFEKLSAIEATLTEAGFGFITADAFIDLLIKSKYKFYGDFVVKNRRSYGRLCAEIVAADFPDGIHITRGDDIARLRTALRAKYGRLDIPENDRSFMARVIDFLVLRGRSVYISPKNVVIEDAVLEEIKTYIDNFPYHEVYYSQIFAEYEGLLMMTSNIDNATFLHGVLAWRYPDSYEFGRDFLRKPDAEESASFAERIRAFLAEAGHAVAKKEIMDRFPGVTEAIFSNAIYLTSDLLQWDTGVFTCAENLNISFSDRAEFLKILKHTLGDNGGYCNQELLYRQALELGSGLCSRHNILSSSNAFCIFAHLFGDEFEFSRPHISLKGRFKGLEAKLIAMDLLGHPDVLDSNDFFALARKLAWPDVTASYVFADVEKEYIRLSKNTYKKKEHFIVSEEDRMYISGLLDKSADGGQWYLPLQHFSDSEDLSPGGIHINEFIVGSVVSQYGLGWHVVKPQAKDRRYERGILVRNDKAVTAYDQLVAQVIADAGMRTMTASQMLAFLQVHRLTFKVIPKELEMSDYFSFSNDQYSLT